MTELVGWEHSMKNELIIARRTGRSNRAAARRLHALLQEFGLTNLLETRFALAPIPEPAADEPATAS